MEELYLKKYDLLVKSGELISIIGPNGSGKTVLLKKICGRIPNEELYIDNKLINNYSLDYKRNNIVCVFDDNIYNTNNVKDELKYNLSKLNLSYDEINNRYEYFIEYFNIHDSFNIIDLGIEDRIYIKILSLLIIKPTLFCIDDLLTYLNKEKKVKILNFIKENNIIFFNVTSDIEDVLLFDKILVMNKGKREMFDKTSVVLNNEVMFNELGLSLPFIYDINNMLKSYELIKENHIVSRELVDLLWK